MPGRLAVAPLLLVLLLTACDSPTGVGSDLVDEQGGNPVELAFDPVEMRIADEADVTGGSATIQRMLSGVTTDPYLGLIQATGHMDFVTPSTGLTEAFSAGQVSEVILFMDRVYAYGDTSSVLTLRLHDLADEWTATDARADTAFAVSTFVVEHSFDATTASVQIPLPADWVSRWDGALRSATFGTDFHGFRFEPVSGDAVAGFDQLGTFLRAVSGGDTLFFPASRAHTALDFHEPFSPPQDAVILQDGRGIGTVLRFDLDDDRIAAAALSRAHIEIPFDSTLSRDAPAGYVRPMASLIGLTLDAVSVDPDARFTLDASPAIVDGKLRFESTELLSVIRLAADGGSALDHFEIRTSPALVSLDVILLASPAHPTTVPRLVLTVVPFE
jgi:hypothetical protein